MYINNEFRKQTIGSRHQNREIAKKKKTDSNQRTIRLYYITFVDFIHVSSVVVVAFPMMKKFAYINQNKF